MKSFINNCVYLTLYWSILLCGVLAVTLGLGYMDEFCAFLIFGVMVWLYLRNRIRVPGPVRVYFVFICFYTLYSVLLSVNVINSILFDVIQQSKPFVAFWGAYYLSPVFSNVKQTSLRTLSHIVTIVIVIVVFLLGMENAIMVFTGHESGYGGLCLLVAILYYYFSKRTKRDVAFFFILLGLGLISGKAKFYGEFCVAIALFCFCKKKIEFSFKTIILSTILLLVIVFVTFDKFDLYFGSAAREEGDGIARVVLYLRSIDVFRDYFPFGSGFGTYACFASSKYYSPLYYKYGMDIVYGLEPDPQNGNFVADTYYPAIIGEFGVLGCCLLALFWIRIFKKINSNLEFSGNLDDYRLSLLLVATFLIEGIAGPLMLANVGVPMMIVLGLVLCNSRMTNIEKDGN